MASLKKLVQENTIIPSSDKDIRKLCDGRIKILTYDEFCAADDVMSNFRPEYNNCVALLYQFPGENVGHWVAIIYDENVDQINFFNSYGYPPDYESGGRMDLTAALRSSGKNINVNPVRFQVSDRDTSTCGLHVAVRCIFNEYSNREYHKMLSSIAVGKNPDKFDKLVSLMSILPLKKNIPQD